MINNFLAYFFNFVFYYPLIMAFVFMIGSLIYHIYREPKKIDIDNLPDSPLVSILIPCHNEENCIRETLQHLEDIDYPSYEIIVIDDCSTDNTKQIIENIAERHPRLRTVYLQSNQGKGMALTMGALAAQGEFLVCIDADALLDPKSVRYFVWHFLNFPRVGAVTGNPRVRNRTSIIGKIQVGEFSTIVGMIKRSQRVLGKIYTVSGVVAAFRKSALLSVGFWSNDMVTEDIDISWKLQMRFWDIHYEPRALCWILMPETLNGLWRQRLRWAQGGSEVVRKFSHAILDWRQRRLWPIYFEFIISLIWAYSFWMTVILFIAGRFFSMPPQTYVSTILPEWTGIILSIVCLLQLSLGLLLDYKYDKNLLQMFFWLIWYPLVYWVINAAVTVFGLPRAILKQKGTLAIWESPDRGF
jgi:biofilm PGA synthesis N-glycosyltransferase PgaC